MTANGLSRLLAPRSVAVVGATDREGAYGDTLLRNLERLGYDGELWGVNPGRERIRDVPCVPTLRELPAPVDAVAVAVPARAVPDAIEDAVGIGCGGAVVVSAGFGEVESGRELERRLVSTARAASFPVCGPNGNGIVNFPAGAGLWGDSVQRLPSGPVAMISQSGNVAVNALGSRRGIGFHTVISTGNQAVCDASDWLAALSASEGVRSIAMFLESDGDGERLAGALADCAGRGIGVAVLKVGSSEAGAGAAAAHTGSLAGDQRVFRALIEEAGACWARDPHELLELARVLAEPRSRPDRSGGLAFLTCSGGDSGIAADEADRAGLELPPLGPATRRRLAELLPEAATIANPLDYTSQIWAERERLAAIVAAVGDDPAIDQMVIFHDTPADLGAEAEPGWRATRHGLADGAARAAAAPLFSSTLPDLIGEEQIIDLAERGLASVGGLNTAVHCAAELRRPPADPGRLRAIAAAASHRTEPGPDAAWIAEAEAKLLLGRAGVPIPDLATAADPAAAARAAAGLGFPVALKLSSPALRHKSEAGAIALALASAEDVAAAAERLLALPEAAGAELLVEPMAVAGVELLVAARADAVVPALVVGLGGIWTEALDDVAIVPLPATAERVGKELRDLRGAALLTGGRGTEPVDLAAVATAAARVGELLLDEGLGLIEVNPLIARPDGCVAVDAVARRGR
ncbi:MAG: acetate--CoA ligase family protein [Thermoleophilia bacterium]|nr:acetate--CoA ligase family protein [Thermoleophilia bacterium]